MHQKVTLVDAGVATVELAEADNHSFRLHFELTVEVRYQDFAAQVAAMFEKDFEKSRLVEVDDPTRSGTGFRMKVRAANCSRRSDENLKGEHQDRALINAVGSRCCEAQWTPRSEPKIAMSGTSQHWELWGQLYQAVM